MFEEMMEMSGEPGDPSGILLAASMVREDMPWFYEIAMEAYRAIKAGDTEAAEKEVRRLRRLIELFLHGPFMEEFGSKEAHMFAMEFPRVLEHMVRRCIGDKKSTPRRKGSKLPPSEFGSRGI